MNQKIIRDSHNYPGNFVYQEFLPDDLANTPFYEPGENAREKQTKDFLHQRW